MWVELENRVKPVSLGDAVTPVKIWNLFWAMLEMRWVGLVWSINSLWRSGYQFLVSVLVDSLLGLEEAIVVEGHPFSGQDVVQPL